MRVKCINKNYVISVVYAKSVGRCLQFEDAQGRFYHTDDDYTVEGANSMISILTEKGFIYVQSLHKGACM